MGDIAGDATERTDCVLPYEDVFDEYPPDCLNSEKAMNEYIRETLCFGQRLPAGKGARAVVVDVNTKKIYVSNTTKDIEEFGDETAWKAREAALKAEEAEAEEAAAAMVTMKGKEAEEAVKAKEAEATPNPKHHNP